MSGSLAILLVLCAVALVLAGLAHQQRLRARADRRADRLVRELLTPGELAQLEERGYLEVPSRATPGRCYRVPARPGLVTVMEAGRPVVRLCLHPARTLPEGEHVIAHKLLLEGAEAEYWRLANRWMARWWRSEEASQAHGSGAGRSNA